MNHLTRYVSEATFHLNEGNVAVHAVRRWEAFVELALLLPDHLPGTGRWSLGVEPSTIMTGAVGAIIATAIIGVAKSIHQAWLRCQNIRYVRDILSDGMAKALGAKTVFHEGMDACSSADALRAAQYNNMIRMVIAALNQGWLRNLTHSQRRGLLDALNWFHTKDLLAIEKDNRAVFVPVADGFWPSDEMSLGAAQDIFAELESLKWLRIERLQLNTPMATTSKATYP